MLLDAWLVKSVYENITFTIRGKANMKLEYWVQTFPFSALLQGMLACWSDYKDTDCNTVIFSLKI